MNLINYFLTICVIIFGFGCPEKEHKTSKEIFIGTWIEKAPDLFDGISDTIVFTSDAYVEKHFFFDGWNYTISKDIISFQKDDKTKNFGYSLENDNEIVIYNFIDRSLSSEIKDIQFTKIK